MVIIISAIGSNRIIGNGEGLPWHIPSEYDQFLGFVKDQTALMGRRSFESFKYRMLPKRLVLVSRTLKTDKASVFRSFPEALAYSLTFSEDVYICGGQSIYEESIQYADYMYLSFIKGEHEGSVYFPEFEEGEWSVELKEEHDEFIFVIYRRKTNNPEV